MPLESEVVIYTDGGCGHDKTGAWAAILVFEDKSGRKHQREISGGSPDTTNNRMELIGVLEALKTLKWSCHVTIYSDSQYVVNAIGAWANGQPTRQQSGWMNDWKRRGWARKEGPLKNPDLWQLVDEEVRRHKSVRLAWVRGHNGHEYNERCDALCTETIAKFRNENTFQSDGLQEPRNCHDCDGGGSTTQELYEGIRQSGPGTEGDRTPSANL